MWGMWWYCFCYLGGCEIDGSSNVCRRDALMMEVDSGGGVDDDEGERHRRGEEIKKRGE